MPSATERGLKCHPLWNHPRHDPSWPPGAVPAAQKPGCLLNLLEAKGFGGVQTILWL